jgi:hypothetical protein
MALLWYVPCGNSLLTCYKLYSIWSIVLITNIICMLSQLCVWNSRILWRCYEADTDNKDKPSRWCCYLNYGSHSLVILVVIMDFLLIVSNATDTYSLNWWTIVNESVHSFALNGVYNLGCHLLTAYYVPLVLI